MHHSLKQQQIIDSMNIGTQVMVLAAFALFLLIRFTYPDIPERERRQKEHTILSLRNSIRGIDNLPVHQVQTVLDRLSAALLNKSIRHADIGAEKDIVSSLSAYLALKENEHWRLQIEKGEKPKSVDSLIHLNTTWCRHLDSQGVSATVYLAPVPTDQRHILLIPPL